MTYIKTSTPKVARIYTDSSATNTGFELTNFQAMFPRHPTTDNLILNDPESLFSSTGNYDRRLSVGDYHVIAKYRFAFANNTNASSFAYSKNRKTCSILRQSGTGSVTQIGKVFLDFDNGGGSIGTEFCNVVLESKIRISGGDCSPYYLVSGGSPFTDSNITNHDYFECTITQYPLNTF